jgi:hypothetical protein
MTHYTWCVVDISLQQLLIQINKKFSCGIEVPSVYNCAIYNIQRTFACVLSFQIS